MQFISLLKSFQTEVNCLNTSWPSEKLPEQRWLWQGNQLTRLGNFLTLVKTSETSTQNSLYNDAVSVRFPLHPQPLVSIQHICIYSLDLYSCS